MPSPKTAIKKGHSLKKKFKNARFVKRALRLGVGSTEVLSQVSGVKPHKIHGIRRRLKARGKLQKGSLRTRVIKRLLMEGELREEEIARRITPKFLIEQDPKALERAAQVVRTTRYRLKKEGIATTIPGVITPPVAVARALLKFEVLRQLTDWSRTHCESIAEAELKGTLIRIWRRNNPNIFEDAKRTANGFYWKKALKQLREEGWIAMQEERFGKKFNPELLTKKSSHKSK